MITHNYSNDFLEREFSAKVSLSLSLNYYKLASQLKESFPALNARQPPKAVSIEPWYKSLYRSTLGDPI